MGDEEEQVLALLLSKGAAETALADEMGRLRVQEEVSFIKRLFYSVSKIAKHEKDVVGNASSGTKPSLG